MGEPRPIQNLEDLVKDAIGTLVQSGALNATQLHGVQWQALKNALVEYLKAGGYDTESLQDQITYELLAPILQNL